MSWENIGWNIVFYAMGAWSVWLWQKQRHSRTISKSDAGGETISHEIRSLSSTIETRTAMAVDSVAGLLQPVTDAITESTRRMDDIRKEMSLARPADPGISMDACLDTICHRQEVMLKEMMTRVLETGQSGSEDHPTPDEIREQNGPVTDLARDMMDIAVSSNARLSIVSGQIKSFTEKIEDGTESAIVSFTSLLERLNGSIAQTTRVVDGILEKMALCELSECTEESESGLKAILEKYELMLGEVMTQFTLTIERKSEDIERLDHIWNKMGQITPFFKDIKEIATSTKMIALNAMIEAARAGESGRTFRVVANEVKDLAEHADISAEKIGEVLNATHIFIDESIQDLKQAMDVESKFIRSTIVLIRDVTLSLVSSFVEMSQVMDRTLGDSSSFRDEVNAVIFNLQFEDICKQMSQHTLQLLGTVSSDLTRVVTSIQREGGTPEQEDVRGRVLGETAGLFTMADERETARNQLNASGNLAEFNQEDSVEFYPDGPLTETDQPSGQSAPVRPEMPEDDGVTFF